MSKTFAVARRSRSAYEGCAWRHAAHTQTIMGHSRRNPRGEDAPQVAANGLLDRRALLGRGALLAGAMTAGAAGSLTGAAAEPLSNGPWSLAPGVPVPP